MRKTLSLIAITIVGMGALAAPAVAHDRNDYTYGNNARYVAPYTANYNRHEREEKARLERLARLRRERARNRWSHDHYGWR